MGASILQQPHLYENRENRQPFPRFDAEKKQQYNKNKYKSYEALNNRPTFIFPLASQNPAKV